MKLHFIEGIGSILIVGLGQIVKGQSRKGILFLLAFYFALPAILYVSLLFSGLIPLYALGFVVFSGIILWIYSAADALLGK
jgi:hypothetical protein